MASTKTNPKDLKNTNNSTRTRSSENSRLQYIVQQTINNIEVGTKEFVMRSGELKLSETNCNCLNDDYESNTQSETSLITNTKPVQKIAPHWRQAWASMGPYLMLFSAGLSGGYSATLLPQLREEHNPIMTDNKGTASWIASMAALPMAPACIIGGWLMEKYGRKFTLIILSIPFFLGWVLIASATNLSQMLIGRFLNGASVGLIAPILSVYVSECTAPVLRGMFLAFLSLFLAIGVFVVHLIGTWLSWQYTAIISGVFPLISAVLLFGVPESPVWLFSKQSPEKAIKAFYWLRGYDEEAENELQALIERYETIEVSSASWIDKVKEYHSKSFYRPFIIVVTIYITSQFSGVPTITFYSIDITETAVGEGINRYLAMLVIDLIRVVSTLITCLTCKKYPRRYLCIISGAFTTLFMALLALFLYFQKNTIPSYLAFVPLCLLSLYIIAVNIGFLPLPWIIVGEIFPAKYRSIGAGLSSAIGYFCTFVVVKTAPQMMLCMGLVATFMSYALFSLVGTVILYYILPETKDKSLLDIELLFQRDHFLYNKD